MARLIFRLPDIGEGVAQAELTAWHVTVGERLAEDQLMAEVMTDKANVEMTAPAAGIVRALHGKPGEKIAVGAPLIELETDAPMAHPPSPAPPLAWAAPTPPVHASAGVRAAPATRRRAREQGVDLRRVTGTGPEGRITDADLAALRPNGEDGVREIPIIGLRRQIGDHLHAATRDIPHFTYVEDIDMTALETLRADLNAARAQDQPHLTLLPFFMRALALTLPSHPHLNARYDGQTGRLRVYRAVHIGIATHTPGGLLVPVVRQAERLDLWDAARELARLTAAARDGRARREELTGSTITLSSLGALGGLAATPILNAPEVAILAPNKLAPRPMVRDGQIVIRTMMNLSAAFDHRIIDGFEAAAFIQALRGLLEAPTALAAPP
jgi:2-oxoisovalerate dehydrogenase E2 component (dihydrolipoyl transacylase)